MAKAAIIFNSVSNRSLFNSLTRIGSTCQLIQTRYRGHDGNLDINTWDGERFVTSKKHREAPIYPDLYSGKPPAKGIKYDKKPFRVEVEAGKTYMWCSCGHSRNQPFCDRRHFYEEGSSQTKDKPRMRPVKYVATESKTVYFCNCKQTNNRPFCDNTHKLPEIQDTNTIFRN